MLQEKLGPKFYKVIGVANMFAVAGDLVIMHRDGISEFFTCMTILNLFLGFGMFGAAAYLQRSENGRN